MPEVYAYVPASKGKARTGLPRKKADAPRWVVSWCNTIAKRYDLPKPRVLFEWSEEWGSSGWADAKGNRVALSLGRALTGQKIVLLHEMAHWVLGEGHQFGRTSHGRHWADVFADLRRAFKIRPAWVCATQCQRYPAVAQKCGRH